MAKKEETLIKKIASRYLSELVGFFLGIYNLDDHFIINSLDKSAVIVDLGAGKGEFPDRILGKWPNCRIILVEPDPSLANVLTKKYENQNNVEVFEAAVGIETLNNVKFFLSRNWQANTLHKSFIEEREYENEITVRMVTLENIFSLFHLEKIDLLKIDVEGEEWNLIEQFSKHDFERISQISIEFHDFYNPSLRGRSERCIKLLRQHGYTFVHTGKPGHYYNCSFYDKKRLKWTTGAKWLGLPKLLINKL